MEIRIDATGVVAVHAGTLSTGQGHETMFAQMISDWLEIPLGDVRVFQGDTDKILFGRGSYAQRTMSTGGSALRVAADEVVRKAKRFAAWMMEAAEADVVLEHGLFRVAGTDRQLTWREVARKSYAHMGTPPELGIGLEAAGTHQGPDTFPNGCIIAEVEVDIDTGVVRIDRISSVDDAGTVVNPLTIDGQLHGSLAQAIGEMLLERVIYEPGTGQLLTGSFMDYAMPRADIMPAIVAEHSPVPTKVNLLGTKGGSEAGNAGGPAAIVNAVIDALSPLGVTDLTLPIRSEVIWRALDEARRTGRGSEPTRPDAVRPAMPGWDNRDTLADQPISKVRSSQKLSAARSRKRRTRSGFAINNRPNEIKSAVRSAKAAVARSGRSVDWQSALRSTSNENIAPSASLNLRARHSSPR